MAINLVAIAHGRALRQLSDFYGLHFQGLEAAIRFAKRHGRIHSMLARKLLNVETTFNILKHRTTASSDAMLAKLETALSFVPPPGLIPPLVSSPPSVLPAVDPPPPSSTTSWRRHSRSGCGAL